jgi:hypothetical protein
VIIIIIILLILILIILILIIIMIIIILILSAHRLGEVLPAARQHIYNHCSQTARSGLVAMCLNLPSEGWHHLPARGGPASRSPARPRGVHPAVTDRKTVTEPLQATVMPYRTAWLWDDLLSFRKGQWTG